MKIAVTGCLGNMGSRIAEAVIESEDEVVFAVEAPDHEDIGKDLGETLGFGEIDVQISSAADFKELLVSEKPDVVIDFTMPQATLGFVEDCIDVGINIVVGTTGFTDEVKEAMLGDIQESDISAIISPNYSVGVNVFWKLVSMAARTLNYDAEIVEVHHNQKVDSPSGTAMKTAEIIKEMRGEGEFVYGRSGVHEREKNEIGVHSVRAGDVVGDHTVYFSGTKAGERIEITHRAHDRQAFVQGALMAAKYLLDQPPGLYSMDDILGFGQQKGIEEEVEKPRRCKKGGRPGFGGCGRK
ncbi:4-hydroxy-tetrahydrodipicolinate reductase [Methanonatronarchaeum sp. AMET-Sl]|uniref:4-hydroxy-tetrahydrodipicolinate reductase n=1 Tax=Methanonatronarchaeum sp. AMET-Sl TaxID=3037654 RepID=UPI00244DAE9E|nr:4-hydroxy-tetrahydrodipicolinate reductase [Methanonatronarchaeum sp. AMET-Sl]WGI18141.1 4-hydroxy-tetrahydrodipicolinate reductase [Methanonatronarchaeum sp. AMET-Sl]